MEQLRELQQELSTSGAKLYQAARKKGLDITKAQANEVAKSDDVRQTFQRPVAGKGAIATNQETSGGVWQADLIDLKAYSAKKNDGNANLGGRFFVGQTTIFWG